MLKRIYQSVFLKPIAIVLIGCFFVTPNMFGANNKVNVKTGTAVMVQLTQDISSNDIGVGQLISGRVLNDVKINGKTVIASGAPVKGQVVSVNPPKSIGRPGSISVMINSVQAVDGTQITLSSPTLKREGKNKKALAWGLGIGAGVITYGVGILLIFVIKGEEGKISAGTIIDANVATNAEVDLESTY